MDDSWCGRGQCHALTPIFLDMKTCPSQKAALTYGSTQDAGAYNRVDIRDGVASGNGGAKPSLDELFPRVYEQLRGLAAGCLRREHANHTLAPTALVHEAYIRLAAQNHIDTADRARFMGLAGEMMRRILVNHARARYAEKRGGGRVCITLDESVASSDDGDLDLVALDEALTRLAVFDDRGSRIVEMRFFAGLSIDETAHVLDISPATVKREWSTARAWLRREMSAQ